ncbi:MAG TPA: hypothetical protein VG294_13310, partial [Solirubrobacteraceae bacterium]|nr:hypothetical protein [Solirubrobacteraceae bacterium]
MPIDLDAAERFVLANARLLDRHRLAVLLHGAPIAPVLATLRAYRNPDGGFGHALEPDVRAPESEPASTLHALEVLHEIGALEDPMIAGAAAWIGSVAGDDGGVPFVLPTAARHPHAPWMVPSDGGSFLTFALAAALWRTPVRDRWLERATEWSWAQLEGAESPGGYWVKFALDFLGTVPDPARAAAAIEALRPALGEDGSMLVPGGVEDERITALTLSPRPGDRHRVLFTEDQIAVDLDALAREQHEDGGWMFDHLAWSAGQAVEWRGIVTLRALATLRAHG